MEYLWIYLALSASFAGGFTVCAMLSWRQIELARRRAERRVKILETAARWCLRQMQELNARRTGEQQQVPPEAIERHLRS